MRKKLLIIMSVIVGLIFSACSNKAPFKESSTVSNGALVYVYAKEDSNVDDVHYITSYDVVINGYVTDKSLYAGEYIKLDVKPGVISISTARKDLEVQTVKLNVQAGNIYYLRLQSHSSSFGKFDFSQVDSNTGRSEISDTVSSSEFMIKGNVIDALIQPSTNSNTGSSSNTAAMSEAEINAMIEKKLAERMSKVQAPKQTSSKLNIDSAIPDYTRKAGGSKMDEIQRAYDMKEKGILSEDEFSKIKADILAK